MICPNCKKELPESANFCTRCGTDLKKQISDTENTENLLKDKSGLSSSSKFTNKHRKSRKRIDLRLIVLIISLVLIFLILFINYYYQNYGMDLFGSSSIYIRRAQETYVLSKIV